MNVYTLRLNKKNIIYRIICIHFILIGKNRSLVKKTKFNTFFNIYN